jgi:hypothetical protein
MAGLAHIRVHAEDLLQDHDGRRGCGRRPGHIRGEDTVASSNADRLTRARLPKC